MRPLGKGGKAVRSEDFKDRFGGGKGCENCFILLTWLLESGDPKGSGRGCRRLVGGTYSFRNPR